MEQRTFIRHLRNNATPAERKLWQHLSARQPSGVRFNRQVRIGPYIADVASRSANLAIELDGDSHADTRRYDAARTRFVEAHGYRVIRFANAGVMTNVEGVVAEIERVLAEPPFPNPSRKRQGNAPSSPLPPAGGAGGGQTHHPE